MMCIRKYDASAENFLDMPIDHRNLLWNINFLKFPWLFLNFPDFQQNSKFPWQILKFPDFSLTLNFPDFSLTSGNPDLRKARRQVIAVFGLNDGVRYLVLSPRNSSLLFLMFCLLTYLLCTPFEQVILVHFFGSGLGIC